MFTEKEKKLIVNALLFTGCTDVMNNLDEKAQMKMIDIAILIGEDPTNEVEMFYNDFEQPKIAEKILDNFTIKKA